MKVQTQAQRIAELLKAHPRDKVYYSAGLAAVVMVLRPGRAHSAYYQLPYKIRHSPTGFSWGHDGSGPADLARCILLDFVGSNVASVEIAEQHYQAFKRDFVAKWPMDGHWTLSGAEIRKWLKARGVEV